MADEVDIPNAFGARLSPEAEKVRRAGPIFQRAMGIAQRQQAAQASAGLALQRENRIAETARLTQERLQRLEALNEAKLQAKLNADIAAATHAKALDERTAEFFNHYNVLSQTYSPLSKEHAQATMALSANYPELAKNQRVTGALQLAKESLIRSAPAPALPEGAVATGGTVRSGSGTTSYKMPQPSDLDPPLTPEQQAERIKALREANPEFGVTIDERGKTRTYAGPKPADKGAGVDGDTYAKFNKDLKEMVAAYGGASAVPADEWSRFEERKKAIGKPATTAPALRPPLDDLLK